MWQMFVLIALAGLLAPGPTPTPAAERDGATPVVAIQETVITLDPAMYRHRVTETALRNMFDGLVTRRQDGTIVPEIAESYRQVNPTTWEFKIRRGITFHNGEALDADSVKFTFDRILTEGFIDGKTSPRKSLLPRVQSVDRLDDFTVRFVLAEPAAPAAFLAGLVHNQIVPRGYLTRVGNRAFAEGPVGAGPFKFVEGRLDERIVMERYDAYYGGSPEIPPVGPPRLKRVLLRVMPELATRVAALKAGEVHLIQGVRPDLVAQLQADPNLQVRPFSGTNVIHWALNVKRAPFDKLAVRRALNHAVDWKLIIDKVLQGQATSLAGVTPFFSAHVNKDIRPYGYSPEQAKKLLAEAGSAGGVAFVLDTTDEWRPIAEAIAAQVRPVGFNATVRVWGDFGSLQQAALKGERQTVVQIWGNAYRHPIDHMQPILMSGGRGNYAQYSNARVDELIRQGLAEGDPRKADQAFFRAQEIIWEEAPLLFGFVPNDIEAASKRVVNWTPGPDGRILLHRVNLQ